MGRASGIGKEITLYSVWYELRWGITACLMLTIGLITVVFYYHPSTTNVTSYLPHHPDPARDAAGRVAEVYVGVSGEVKKGDPHLQARQHEAGGRSRDRPPQDRRGRCGHGGGQIRPRCGRWARSSRRRARCSRRMTNCETKEELDRRNADIVARREIERLQIVVDGRQGALDAAIAGKEAAETQDLDAPAGTEGERRGGAARRPRSSSTRRSSMPASTGRVEQFVLRVGDVVNPFMRPAGILIPRSRPAAGLQAGFGQIEAQVMKVGMIAEVTCVSKPFTIIPMVVTGVQDFIATGQFRAGDQLVDLQQMARPGTITRLPGAALRGRHRRCAAGQQLHRQRLQQQSRCPSSRRTSARGAGFTCMSSTPWRSCMP